MIYRPLAALPILFAVLLGAALGPPLGCSAAQQATERSVLVSAEPTLLAADAWACDEGASLIPVYGALADALVCPAWEAAVKAELDKLTAAPTVATKVVTKVGTIGKLVVKGSLPARVDAGAR